MSTGLVWFRKDLRLTDNPAWAAATAARASTGTYSRWPEELLPCPAGGCTE